MPVLHAGWIVPGCCHRNNISPGFCGIGVRNISLGIGVSVRSSQSRNIAPVPSYLPSSMKQLLFALFVMLVALPQGRLLSQGSAPPGIGNEMSYTDLFAHRDRPASHHKPIPSSAAFFTIDPLAFDRLSIAHHPSLTLENFQLSADQRVTLELHQFEVLSPGAPVVAGTMQGDQPADLPRGLFFTGSVPEIKGSFIYLAIFSDYCSGYIEVPGLGDEKRRYTIAPLELADQGQSTMVIYDETEALNMVAATGETFAGWGCGAEGLEGYEQASANITMNHPRSLKGSDRELQANNMLVAQIAIDCDSAFYVMHGRSLSRAAHYALTVVGAISAIYQRDVNVTIQVPYLRVWTGSDPYRGTTLNTLLPQLRNYWNANMSSVRRTLVHMFSVSSIGGGIAYINMLCANTNNGFGYSLTGLGNTVTYPTSAYFWDTDASSHEIGHNFGSPHTHSCNWSPAIDSCYPAEGNCFTGTKGRVGTIMSYCHLTSFGTQLYFHPRVAELLRYRAEDASCVVPLEGSTDNDVAVAQIETPATGGLIASGTQFIPAAVVKNVGTDAQTSLLVTATIKDSAGTQFYTSSRTIASLAPGATADVAFNQIFINTIARYFITVEVTLTGDSYPANNTMVRPFEIVSGTSGSFTLTAPNTRTIFRAGETTTIRWLYTGAITNARIDFSPDDGATWMAVATNVSPSGRSSSWVVPAIPTKSGRIRISDRENAGTRDESDEMFTIELQPLEWQWARSLGGPKEDLVSGIGHDSRGNIYVTGTYQDSTLLGSTKLTSTGGQDMYIAKYNAGGSLQWAKTLGGVGDDSAMALAVDANGDLVITGSFQNTMTLGTKALTSAGVEDVFVAKYDANGDLRWAQRNGGTGRDQGRGVGMDGTGNVIVVGSFSRSVGFGSISLGSQGESDMFIAKYASADGTVQWAQRGGGSSMDEANAVSVDQGGTSVVVGRYRGSGSFGGDNLTSAGEDDGFVAKYNALGVAQWGETLGGKGFDEATDVAIDASSNAIVMGTIENTVNFGTIYAASTGDRDMFIARYGVTGIVRWVRTAGSTLKDAGTALAVDGVGNIYVGGHFLGTFSVGNQTVASLGETDAVVIKLNTEGALNWVRRGGGVRAEEIYGIVAGANGDHVNVAGRFNYNLPADQPSMFGPDNLRGAGGRDIMVARLASFRITSPVEGNTWESGTAQMINWSSFPASTVKIEYTVGAGGVWTTIVASTPNDGSYEWSLPLLHLPLVTIRVSDADNPAVYGYAMSGAFTILGTAPATQLTATPQDGAVALAWTPSIAIGVTGYELYRGTTEQNMVPIATVGSAVRTYLDQSVTNCTDYFYGVVAQVGVKKSQMSNIAGARPSGPSAFTASNPLANESLRAGETKTLTWTATGCAANVALAYSINAGADWVPIIGQTENDGSYDWQIPNVASSQALVRVSDPANGASSDVSEMFKICNVPATIAVTGSTTICEGEPTALSAPAGFASYSWSNGATTQSISVTDPGSYSVTITDAGGCSVTSDPLTVTANPKPQAVATAGGPTTFCQGGSVKLTAPDGFSEYRWSSGHTGREITVTQTGRYTVTVTGSNGCRGTSEPITVMVVQKPQVTIVANGPTSFYAGQNVKLSVPDGFDSYLWSTGATTREITVVEPGVYSVTVITEEGCQGVSQQVIVKIIPTTQPMVAAEGATILCHGDSVVLTAATGYVSYLWSNGATTRSVTISETGIYTVAATDAGGQTGLSDPIEVVVHAAPVKPVLQRAPGTDSLIYDGINGTIYWERDGMPVEGAIDRQILAVSNGIYRVTVIDSNGCVVSSDPLPVTLNAGSVDIVAGGRGMMVHPNPGSGRFFVEMDLLRPVPVRIAVTDLRGNVVLKIEEPAVSGGYRREIDITRFPAGAYMIELQAGSGKWTRKVVKQ